MGESRTSYDIRPDPVDLLLDGDSTFVAGAAPGGLRWYKLECRHGKTELNLADHPDDSRDGEVLAWLVRTLRGHTGCRCEPRGWTQRWSH